MRLLFIWSMVFLITTPSLLKATDPWLKADSILNSIKEPQFPNRSYKITDYKGKSGSGFDNTKIINRLIDRCSKAGGGKVVIPEGVFFTGPITLKSNVNLHLEEGAVLKFSNNPADYTPFVETRWEGMDVINYRPLIYANGVTNIAVTGNGKLDGQATNETWWWMKGRTNYGWDKSMPSQYDTGRPKLMKWVDENTPIKERVLTQKDLLRPQFISPIHSSNILIEGVTIVDAPFWVIHPIFCNNIIVRNVSVISHGPNNDGCNPESCRNVLIEGSTFDTGDDCIAIKSGRNNDGRNTPIPSENIVVRNCFMKDGHGGVVMGSEISAGVRNVFVEDCQMDSPELERVVRIKSNTVRGGFVDGLYLRNIEVGECKGPIFLIELDYEPEDGTGDFPPVIKNIVMDNVTSNKSKNGVLIRGLKESIQITDIDFINCHFNNVTHPVSISGAKNINFKNFNTNVVEVK